MMDIDTTTGTSAMMASSVMSMAEEAEAVRAGKVQELIASFAEIVAAGRAAGLDPIPLLCLDNSAYSTRYLVFRGEPQTLFDLHSPSHLRLWAFLEAEGHHPCICKAPASGSNEPHLLPHLGVRVRAGK